ncbi:MAG: hypothetical protein F4Y01_16455 [Gammaproteobacteria bacterium]|nr:hypothetical protein [Gammaproteobacteria bacterium]
MPARDSIKALPTKAFFVEMLVRDIPVENAVLDLVDNCIDGARRLRPEEGAEYSGLTVTVKFDRERFLIEDNCGGFDVAKAETYAFRFGRPSDADATPHSIGQFGVGMKRALFKFGRYFEVSSTTPKERWSMHVDVAEWLADEEGWTFSFDDVTPGEFGPDELGTRIEVRNLRSEVAARFASPRTDRQLAEMIRSHQGQFLARGLRVTFNGRELSAADLSVRSGGKFNPGIESLMFDEGSGAPVTIKLIVGVSDPSPAKAGWYVVCNRRVIVAADRTELTGWGTAGESRGLPKYHNDYARFRGVVFFDCDDAGKVPWNTTKTGLDDAATVWQQAYDRMIEHSRSVFEFLNELANDVAEHGGERSRLLKALTDDTVLTDVGEFGAVDQRFEWDKEPRKLAPKTIGIHYWREESKIEALKGILGVGSAKAVGENSFDWMYRTRVGDDE